MAKQLELTVTPREDMGKSSASALRKEGYVPGIFYNPQGENVPVQVGEITLAKVYNKVGKSQLFQLKIDDGSGAKTRPCFIWQLQEHPVKNRILHVDFYGVDLKKKIRVDVPVHTEGEPKGTEEGGILSVFRDTIEVECLPLDIPEFFNIDVSELGVNDTVLVSDIEAPENVSLLYDESEPYALVGVIMPTMEEPEEEEEEELAEGEEAEGEEGEGEEGEEAEEEEG